MLSYTNLQSKPRIFRNLSGLSLAEFDRLLLKFEQVWQEYLAKEYIGRDGRQRRYGVDAKRN